MKDENMNHLRQQDKNLRDALRQEEAGLPQMPADLNERLMRRLGEPEAAPKAKTRRLWFYAAIAAAASIALLIIFNFGQERTPQEPLMAQQTVKQDTPQPTPPLSESLEDSSPAVSEPVEEPKSIEKPRPVKKQRETVTMLVELIPTSEASSANVKELSESLIANVKAYDQSSDLSRTTGIDDGTDAIVTRMTDLDAPDPLMAMAAQAEDIRQRGKRLEQEIELRMDN